MQDEESSSWQQRLKAASWAFLKGVGSFLLEVGSAPIPCSQCGQKHMLAEYFSQRDFSASGEQAIPVFCCPTCFAKLQEAARLRSLLARYNRWLAHEQRRVSKQLSRAEKRGNAATLTLEQWLYIGGQFGWKCGYCGGPFEAMEHFRPISSGAGTTAANVLPVCKDCNSWKGDRLPEEIKETVRSPEAVRRVAAKLAQLQLTMPGQPQALQIQALAGEEVHR